MAGSLTRESTEGQANKLVVLVIVSIGGFRGGAEGAANPPLFLAFSKCFAILL